MAAAEVEDGTVAATGEIEETIEARHLATTGGRRSLRTGTMEVETVEEAVAGVEMRGVAVEETGVDPGRATLMTGPSLCPGTRGWRRSSSTLVMDPLASTLRGVYYYH